jgi:fructokinase
MIDALCMGEILIDFVPPGPGPADMFVKAAGGAPANVAVGLARLGIASAFIGKAGADAFGRFLAQTLADASVDIRWLKLDPQTQTPLAFVSNAPDGEREFLFYGDISAGFGPDDLDLAAIERARLLHFGSIGLIQPPSRAATLKAVDAARQNGRHVSFDANLRRDLWSDEAAARASILKGVELATIVKLSDDELAFLTGDGDPIENVRSLWHEGLSVLVITHGRLGSTLFTREGHAHVSSIEAQAVDTTGAGDAFMAAMLAGILDSGAAPLTLDHLQGICRFANAAGAVTTTARGAIPALPTRQRIFEALAAGTAGSTS